MGTGTEHSVCTVYIPYNIRNGSVDFNDLRSVPQLYDYISLIIILFQTPVSRAAAVTNKDGLEIFLVNVK